jgi:hypothetical protein
MMNKYWKISPKIPKHYWFIFTLIIITVSLLTSCSSGIAMAPPDNTSILPFTNPGAATTNSNAITANQTNKTTSTSTIGTGITDTSQAGTRYMSISFDKNQVNPGDTFTLNIMITTDTPIRGVQCDLNIDTTAVQCLSVSEGTVFKNWVTEQNDSNLSTFSMQPTAFDKTSAHIQAMGVAVMGETAKESSTSQYGGVTGTGIVFACQMQALTGIDKTAVFSISNVIAEAVDSKTRDSVPVEGVKTVAAQLQIGP